MQNLNELLDRRNTLRMTAERLLKSARASGKDLAGDELHEYEGILAAIKADTKEIERLQAFSAASHFQAPTTPIPFGHSQNGNGKALTGTLRELYTRVTTEQREQIDALAGYLSGRIYAGADLTPSGDGGVLIPSFVQNALERNYAAFNPVVSVARLFPTDTGADTTFPVLSDSESAAQVDAAAATGADATVSGDTPPTDLTGPTMKAYKVSSKPVFIPRETFTDSPINVIEEVAGAQLARIIRFENARFTSGTGSGQAEGFLTNCSHHAAGAVALDLDIALDLAYSVPALYRPQGVYMMSDTTAKYLRKLKTGLSGDKRQLWADADATKGTPATLHGYPVIINNDMASVAGDGTFAGVTPLAFGDFKRFVVRQAENNQPYAYRYSVPARDGSAVILFRRSDSKLLVSEAICKLTVS